jgi:hypothetical protein
MNTPGSSSCSPAAWVAFFPIGFVLFSVNSYCKITPFCGKAGLAGIDFFIKTATAQKDAN